MYVWQYKKVSNFSIFVTFYVMEVFYFLLQLFCNKTTTVTILNKMIGANG